MVKDLIVYMIYIMTIFRLKKKISTVNKDDKNDKDDKDDKTQVNEKVKPKKRELTEKNKELENKIFENIQEPVKFNALKKMLQEIYNFDESIQSATLDIISCYLKGQKILYTEAKTYCEHYLFKLIIPTIFISAICSVVSGIFKDYNYASITVCILAAINSFLLALINYTKLDAKAEAHKITAASFDKLQSICEFNSGKILFSQLNYNKPVTNENDSKDYAAIDLIEEIETKVYDIKEKNQFILPEYIRYSYYEVFSTNIFAEVKKKRNEEILKINNLKNIINECIDIKKIMLLEGNEEYKELLKEKEDQKEDALDDLIIFRDEYLSIDKDYKEQIDFLIDNTKNSTNCWKWFRV